MFSKTLSYDKKQNSMNYHQTVCQIANLALLNLTAGGGNTNLTEPLNYLVKGESEQGHIQGFGESELMWFMVDLLRQRTDGD